MCHDLRIRLKDITAHQKKSAVLVSNLKSLTKMPINEMFSKQSILALKTHAGPTEDDVHSGLSPLLDYLNVNLGSIAEHTPSELLARSIVSSIWDRIVVIAESLVAPGLDEYEGGKEKRVWEESRVIFLRRSLEVCFFVFLKPSILIL